MNKPISMLARVNSVYDSHVSWTCVRRSWVDLRCSILYSHYRTPYVQFFGVENAPIRCTLSFDDDYWLDIRNISG